MLGTLLRTSKSQFGIFGLLVFDAVQFHTAESANLYIPPGLYNVVWDTEGKVVGYMLADVPNRTAIQIHKGNWAGDTRKGFLSDTEGCILLGLDRRIINGQPAIGRSEPAIQQLHSFLNRAPWRLRIIEAYNG